VHTSICHSKEKNTHVCAPPPSSTTLYQPQQDKIDESEDKEAILGADILNPTTGLSLKDYLEGKEQDHNELLVRSLLGKEGFNNDDSTTYLDSEVRGAGVCCGEGGGVMVG
jgi:hypothetical protein